MFNFRSANIPPELEYQEIMAMRTPNGTEGRFASRFIKYAGTSETFNSSVDKTGQAVDDLRTSAGMINEQKRAIDKLFLRAEEAINMVDGLEKESGVAQVENLPLPTDVIRVAYGKKMGYTSLVMEFLTAGMLHFMEQTINLEQALQSRDNTISRLAASIPQLEIIGAFEEITVSDINAPVDVPAQTYTKAEKPAIPPTANTPKKTKK